MSVAAIQANEPAFPDFSPKLNDFFPANRFQEYANSLDPLLSDLQRNLTDREKELTEASSPLFLLDFSELHYLWTSTRTRKGRVGHIDWQSTLIDAVLSDGGVEVFLPPGAVCEAASQLSKDLGSRSPISLEKQRQLTDPAKGMSKRPGLSEIIDLVPSEDVFLETVEAWSSLEKGEAYIRFRDFIRKGKIKLFHSSTLVKDATWDQSVFNAAYRTLKRRKRSSFAADLWDAVNIAVCAGWSAQSRRTGKVAYLIGRGRRIAEASRGIPGGRDNATSARGLTTGGLARSPIYLYLYAKLARTRSPERVTFLGDMVNDLDQLRRAFALIPASVRREGKKRSEHQASPVRINTVRFPAHKNLVRRVSSFQRQYGSVQKPLYTAWEAYRRTRESQRFLPFASATDFASETADPAHDAVMSLLNDAGDARRFLVALAEENSISRGGISPELRCKVEESKALGRSVTHAGIWLKGKQAHEPIVLVDFVDDYFSTWWYSDLTIHQFLDWVERFVMGMDEFTEGEHVKPREREFNWTYSVVLRDGSERGVRREGPPMDGEHGEHQEDFLDFPLSFEARVEIISSLSQAEALKLHTPFGDLWINLVYGQSGWLRTGLISHYHIPAFVSAIIGMTAAEGIAGGKLFEILQALMTDHLGCGLPKEEACDVHVGR